MEELALNTEQLHLETECDNELDGHTVFLHSLLDADVKPRRGGQDFRDFELTSPFGCHT